MGGRRQALVFMEFLDQANDMIKLQYVLAESGVSNVGIVYNLWINKIRVLVIIKWLISNLLVS